MKKTTKVIFIKNGFYRGKQYKKDDVIDMSLSELDSYESFKVVKRHYETNKQNNDFSKLSYNKLRELCKKNNLPAVGKKEELIQSLKLYFSENTKISG
jgi:hypothetical protein